MFSFLFIYIFNNYQKHKRLHFIDGSFGYEGMGHKKDGIDNKERQLQTKIDRISKNILIRASGVCFLFHQLIFVQLVKKCVFLYKREQKILEFKIHNHYDFNFEYA